MSNEAIVEAVPFVPQRIGGKWLIDSDAPDEQPWFSGGTSYFFKNDLKVESKESIIRVIIVAELVPVSI